MVQPRFGGASREFQRLFSGGSLVGLSDAELLHRYVEGRDQDAFAVLEARHGPLVRAVCRSVLRDPVDAEDAFQATFLILVRQARSLRIDESLAGWLHRVSHRVAVRASVDAARRRRRERLGVNLETVEGPSTQDAQVAELHEAIAGLPERFRRAVVLCELEGMTQVEASKLLRCGEATLRRRLVSARERLRARLSKRGDAGAILAAARLSIQSSTFPGMGRMVPTATALLLARKVSALMILARSVKLAVVLIGVGLATVAAGTLGLPKPKPVVPPRPIVQAPVAAKPKAAEPVHWVHLKSDTYGETWANLDDGIEFRKNGAKVSMLRVKSHELFTYEGNGSIDLSKDETYVDMADKAGRQLPPSAFELAGHLDLNVSRTAPEEQRKRSKVFSDFLFETADGRRLLRMDQYVRDALGEARIDKQVWYDRDTGRPVRARSRLQVAMQHQHKREFETETYDYPETGPVDLTALGVPKEAKIIDSDRAESPWNWAELPPGVRDALTAQAAAVLRFPRSYRVLASDDNNILTLEYWTATDEFVELWCQNKTGDARFAVDGKQPRHFRADNHEYTNRPQDIEQAIFRSKEDLPVDRIVAWFPFESSVNISMVDGTRDYHLTRSFQGEGQPLKTSVHVLGGGFDHFPDLVEEQWPLLRWNRRHATSAAPEADTPPGMVVIQVHQPDPEIRSVFTLDPAHDFIAVRQLEWSNHGDQWHHREKRALRFKQLPSGAWYVSAWEVRAAFGGSPDKPIPRDKEPNLSRIDVTPMNPADFPKDLFDGNKFVEDARKKGATIEVDQ